MTPEQAYTLADEQCVHGSSAYDGCGHPCRDCVVLQITAAITDRQEACAKMASSHHCGLHWCLEGECKTCGSVIAAAIRALP